MPNNNERKKTQVIFFIGILILTVFLIFLIFSNVKTTENDSNEKVSPKIIENGIVEEVELNRHELFKVIKKKPSRPINFNELEK